MPLDKTLVEEALTARERCTEVDLELAQAKADFHLAVRRLHVSGGSLREIATALELSHQRVHQMVEGSGTGIWARLGLSRKQAAPRAPTLCSFCATSEFDVRKLVAGPGVWICDRCIASATRIARSTPSDEDRSRFELATPDQGVRCNFCGKGPRRADRIVMGGSNNRTICNRCLELCDQILDETTSSAPTRPP